MQDSPYLKEHRLQDLLTALQFFATYRDYDFTAEDFREKISTHPRSSSTGWGEVLAEHPEFFRRSEHGADYSLVLRRARAKSDDERRRPPLNEAELSMLIDTAIHLQKHALEMRRERKAWLPLMLTAIGILSAFLGTILGACIKGTS